MGLQHYYYPINLIGIATLLLSPFYDFSWTCQKKKDFSWNVLSLFFVSKWCNKHYGYHNMISLIFLCWRPTVMVYVICRLVILSVLKIALQKRLFWNIWQMGCCCESFLGNQIWKATGELFCFVFGWGEKG